MKSQMVPAFEMVEHFKTIESNTVFTLSKGTSQVLTLTVLVLKFELVQFTYGCCV